MFLTVVPFAGLCNRLNSIASALAYKEKHPEVGLRILWHQSRDCHCRFGDLFRQLPAPYAPVEELRGQWNALPASKYNLFLPQLLRPLWFDGRVTPQDDADAFESLTEGKRRVYVNHANRFCKEELPSGPLGEVFIPTDELRERIREVTGPWEGHRIVGLHIRRTDNLHAISGSPLAHFDDVIAREMEEDSTVRFYLATDDEAVKQELRSRYGERIVTSDLRLERGTLQGMKDAVVDLWCLGSTQKIYGSASSTYSTFAAQLFGKELVI